MRKAKAGIRVRPTVVTIRDFDGRLLRRQFIDPTDALEFRILITRRVQRYKAGLELIPEQVTFAEWIARWLERRKALRPQSTTSGEEGKLRRVWVPRLGKMKMQAIHASTITAIMDELKAKGLSNATLNRHRALLHRIWVEAKREQPALVTVNPISSLPRLPEPWRAPAVWTDDEVERYCAAAWEISIGWGVIATILAWTGMRVSEAVALEWRDDQGDQFHVCRIWEAVSGKIQGRTKSRKPYNAIIPAVVRRALAKAKRWRRKVSPTDRIAGTLTYGQVRHFHELTIKHAELPYTSLHSLRHRVARTLRRAGLSRDDVRDLLGHRSTQTTERYTPPDNDFVVAKAKKRGFGR